MSTPAWDVHTGLEGLRKVQKLKSSAVEVPGCPLVPFSRHQRFWRQNGLLLISHWYISCSFKMVDFGFKMALLGFPLPKRGY